MQRAKPWPSHQLSSCFELHQHLTVRILTPCLPFPLLPLHLQNQSSYYMYTLTSTLTTSTRMSWGTTEGSRRFPNRAAGWTNRKNSQCGGQSRRHCVLHGPASLTSTSFGLLTTLCYRYFLFGVIVLSFGHVWKPFPAPRDLSFTPLWGFADHGLGAWQGEGNDSGWGRAAVNQLGSQAPR